jgi:hypothetical protein
VYPSAEQAEPHSAFLAAYIIGSCSFPQEKDQAAQSSLSGTMSPSNAPANVAVTVTTELAQLYNRQITEFADKNDVTCIEVVRHEVRF